MKFKIFSLGCKVNSYECNAVASALKCAGYIEDNNNPDVVIINTCSVTATADQKSRQHIRKFMKLYPNAITVVMGCYAQGNAEFIANEIQPTILIGTSNRNRILELIEQYQKTHERIVLIDNDTREFKYEELGVTSCSENIRAYLKIQDGCNNFCSYCIIPFRRGKMRSRNKQEVLKEAEYLVLPERAAWEKRASRRHMRSGAPGRGKARSWSVRIWPITWGIFFRWRRTAGCGRSPRICRSWNWIPIC